MYKRQLKVVSIINWLMIPSFLLLQAGIALGQDSENTTTEETNTVTTGAADASEAAPDAGDSEPDDENVDDANADDENVDDANADDENADEANKVDAIADEETADDANEIAALKQQMAIMQEDYNARLEALELKELEALSSEGLETGSRFFGFFDIAFMYKKLKPNDFLTEDSGFVNSSPQFLMQHLNLYFNSKLTSTLSFLTEVQFSFLPNGAMTPSFYEPERQETTVVDPYTQQQYTWGSIMIQRAWMKWEPFEFFGVKAGYYLSPYGIWHEDHASTVRLSILPPFENDTITPPEILGKKPMPKAQLGLQLFGRFFPSDHLRLDYAVTVSNGRGSADTVMDYDDNKGLGLRLKLTYSNPNLEIALGSYGYYGEYSDTFFAYWDVRELENYKEYAVASDLLVTFFGVRLQAEHIYGATRYTDDDLRPTSMWGLNDLYVTPDYETHLFYALLAYELPLPDKIGNHTFTPYVGYEYDLPRDDLKDYKLKILNFGLNYKPSSFVSIKLEASRFDLEFVQNMESTIWTYATQLAVSF